MGRRSLTGTAYPQFALPLQQALRWLNACCILTEADLVRVTWPAGIAERGREKALARWDALGLIQRLDPLPEEHHPRYQLGRLGARKLREAGIGVTATTRPLHARVRPSLTLGSRVIVGLCRDALADPVVRRVAVLVDPFRGLGVRPDGICVVRHLLATSPTALPTANSSLPEPYDPVATPPPDQTAMRYYIEIDRGTEERSALRQRAQR